jgi:hypothetical protein
MARKTTVCMVRRGGSVGGCIPSSSSEAKHNGGGDVSLDTTETLRIYRHCICIRAFIYFIIIFEVS